MVMSLWERTCVRKYLNETKTIEEHMGMSKRERERKRERDMVRERERESWVGQWRCKPNREGRMVKEDEMIKRDRSIWLVGCFI